MGRPAVAPDYVRTIHELSEEGYSAKEIERILQGRAEEKGRNDAPGIKAVEKYLARWRKLPPEERREGALFHWPQSMMDGALPWEASQHALELLYLWREQGRARPTNRLARWYWRVLTACPSLSRDDAVHTAGVLAAYEYVSADSKRGSINIEATEAELARLAFIHRVRQTMPEKVPDLPKELEMRSIVTTGDLEREALEFLNEVRFDESLAKALRARAEGDVQSIREEGDHASEA